jgi:superfamily I DNA/RNA helicase
MQINLIKKQLMELGEVFTEGELENFTEFINNTNGLKFYEQEFNFRNLSKILAYAYV